MDTPANNFDIDNDFFIEFPNSKKPTRATPTEMDNRYFVWVVNVNKRPDYFRIPSFL